MSYRLLSDSWPISTKPYRCIWCGEPIPVGERHRHERSVFDGSFQNHRWHTECNADAIDCLGGGDEEFLPYENERPRGES